MIIQGNIHIDNRGIVRFVNDFDFKGIKRFYSIIHPSSQTIRAWQGHQKEKKYFYAARGSFLFKWIEIDNWETPSKDLKIKSHILSEMGSELLVVEPGHVTGFKGLEPGSVLLVFSDVTLEESKADDYRFPEDYWKFLAD